MKKMKIIVLTVLVAVSALVFLLYNSIEHDEYVQNGVIDLASIPLESNVVSLNGEWEFYPNKLLEPRDLLGQGKLDPHYIKVPSTWNSIKNNMAFDERGCGTYRLFIKNMDAHRQYGIIKKNIRIASRIYVDGELVMEDGNPSATETDEIMGNSPHVVTFSARGDTAAIIIQVSNFKYYSGGITEAIRFGFAGNVIRENTRNIIFESIIFAFVIAIGVIYGILALMLPYAKKKDRASMLLPVAVIMFAIVNGAMSERIVMHIFPFITTQALIRIEYAAIAMLFISLFSMIHFMDRKLLPKKVNRVVQLVFVALLAAALFAPMKYYITWTIFTYISTAALIFGFVFMLVKYLIRNKIGLGIEEHTFILILLYIMNVYNIDVYMFTFGHKNDMNIAMISTAIYGMTWLAWIVYRYKVAYRENEELTLKLLENHYAMEQTSRSARRSEMAFLQAQIKPHFLFNSLSSILSLLRSAPKRAEKMMVSLSEYLKDLFDVDMSTEYIHIENELNIIRAYVSIEKERFGDRIDVRFDIEPDILSCRIIPLLIQPLVENAMHHGALKREEDGVVMLSIKSVGGSIDVVIEDNGPGFSKRAIETLEKSESAEEHKGVGVRNIIDRLRYYYNEELRIENKEEGGVRISFCVPILEEEMGFAKNSDR